MADLKAQLAMSPQDGVDYFRRKGEVVSWDWHDVQAGEHARAFTVAKATSLDVLRTIRKEADKAIDGGSTFEQFKRTLRPQLQDAGWWGKAEVLDGDTGELTTVQLGSDRRLRTIFQTNVQTSYMAGLFTRFLDNAEDRPYWQYIAVMDGRTRPMHAAMHGKIYRYDDPVWSIIFPPNGWGCRCRVVPLTEAEAIATGLPILSGADSIVEQSVMLGMVSLYPDTARFAPLVASTLQQPFEVWLTPYEDGSYRTRYFSIFQGVARLLSFVRVNRDGSLFWNVRELTEASTAELNAMRQGTLLFGTE